MSLDERSTGRGLPPPMRGPLPGTEPAAAPLALSTTESCAALVANFGLAIRQLRERQGLSQEKLSELSELNRSYVGEVERGRAIASIVTAHKLAHALNVDVAALLRHGELLERQRVAQRLRLAAIAC